MRAIPICLQNGTLAATGAATGQILAVEARASTARPWATGSTESSASSEARHAELAVTGDGRMPCLLELRPTQIFHVTFPRASGVVNGDVGYKPRPRPVT